MTAAEKYAHILSVLDAALSKAEAELRRFERNGWDDLVPQAQAEWDDFATLYDAISEGALDDIKSEYASRRALIGGAL